jgi:UDP-N-acetylmuramoylalanine-D-glutamate ligase
MGGVLKYSCKEQAYKEVEELSLYAKDKVIGVIGFGKYGDIFTSPFAKYGVKYVYSLPRLEDAFAKSLALANLEKENFERVAILLAPGGASFDEFKSAEERGKFFDKLVENFVQCAKT